MYSNTAQLCYKKVTVITSSLCTTSMAVNWRQNSISLMTIKIKHINCELMSN